MEVIAKSIAVDFRIEIFGGILGCTQTKTVESQRKLIALAVIGIVFTARIQFTEYQLPVKTLLFGVIIHRYSSSKILHLNGMISPGGHDHSIAKSFSGFINGVRKNFKNRVFASFQSIRTKDDTRTLSDTICSLQ